MTTTEVPTRNRPLLYAIAARIETEPESYDQSKWVETMRADGLPVTASFLQEPPEVFEHCQTKACIYGHALLLGAPEFIELHPSRFNRPTYLTIDRAAVELARQQMENAYHDADCDGANTDYVVHGAQLLGLTIDECYGLFSEHWEPRAGLTVPQALRAIADGATVEDVSE